MVLQLYVGQAQAHIGGGGHGHDVDGRAKGNQEGSTHSGSGDAIAGDDLIDNGQDAVGQRITVDEHAQGAVYGGENHVQVGSHACGHGRQDHVGHGIQHGALAHNANEHAGGQGGKGHGQGIGGVGLDPLSLGFLGGIVDHEANGQSHHKGHMGGDLGKGQHQDNGNDQQNIEPEQLGPMQLVDFLDVLGSGSQILLTGYITGTPLLFVPGQKDAQAQNQYQTKNLGGDAVFPNLRGAHFQSGSGTAAGSAPGDDVHDTHGQGGNAQQVNGPDIHLLVDGQQGRNGDQQGGGTGAVQVADEGDEHGGKHQQGHIVANQLQNLANDPVKYTGIVHHAEEQHRKNKQNSRGGDTGHTGGNIAAHFGRGKAYNKTGNNGQKDKNNSGGTLAPQQQGDNEDHEGKACDTQHGHRDRSFLICVFYSFSSRFR